jgi:PAS domain S-box-containing protein
MVLTLDLLSERNTGYYFGMAKIPHFRPSGEATDPSISSIDGDSRFRPWFSTVRLVSLCVLLCMVPLALLTYFTIQLADRAVAREVDARVRTTSAVTAVLIQKQMQAVAELTVSYASRPILVGALGDGDPARFQGDAILQQLNQLKAALPGVSGAFVTDANCRLTQVEPATQEIVGVDFSFRDWCTGARGAKGPYISEAYQSAIVGQPLVVAAAVMVRAVSGDNVGRPLGIVAVVYPLDALRDFGEQLARAQGIQLLVTDQRGSVLVGNSDEVHAGGLMSAAADPRVRAALGGQSGAGRSTGADGEVLSAFAPVDGVGWTVTAQVPAREALAGVSHLRSTVLTVAGGLALVLAAGIILLARSLRLRRAAQRNLAEREAHMRSILDAGTDAFVAMDDAGRITGWSGQAEEVFGWTAAETLGQSLSETIIPSAYRAQHEEGLARFLASGEGPVLNQRIEISALHRDGHEFPVELAIWPVKLQGAWSFNAFVHDITDRRAAQSELASARDQALETSQLKSEFLATMSHEIRTPMNGVIGLTGLLLDTELTETQRHHAEGVRASGEALLGIINDILDFSKIEAGKLELETVDFDVTDALEDVAALVTQSAQAKDLELVAYCRPEVPTTLRGDVGRLRQILLNFATNAIKFTETGEVVLRASVVEQPSGEQVVLRFEVADTGVGLDSTAAERLFEPFSQADASTTRRYGGTGLGLAICRRLAEAMGGAVGVDSQPGVGSTFWLRLPLARSSEPVAVPDGDAHSLKGRRVLIVDDNRTNRVVLASQLLAWDIHADLACDAEEALQHLRLAAAESSPYELALLDMAMPEMDGMELAAIVSSDPELCSVRLLLLSSVSVDADAAAEAGFVARLTKPVRLSSLYDAMVRAVAPPAEDAMSVPAPTTGANPGYRGTLLVVEDHAINQEVAKGIVAKLGYGCDVASNGVEALVALERRTYDAVLMDCNMPEMDGFQATVEIRRREGGERHVPIIAMTAAAMAEDRGRCIAAGMDDYVSKPVKERHLEAVLNRWALGGGAVPDRETCGTSPDGDVLDATQFDGLRRLATASGDTSFLRNLIDQYLDIAWSELAKLREADARGDAPALLALAHGLKGTSATMGACGVANACESLEDSARRGEMPGPQGLDRVATALEQAATALHLGAPAS